MSAAAYTDVLQKFYIAYFGRPADPTGLLARQALADSSAPTTTQALLDAYDSNVTVRALINGFGNSESPEPSSPAATPSSASPPSTTTSSTAPPKPVAWPTGSEKSTPAA